MSGKVRKRQKNRRPTSREGAQTPLKPPLGTSPFVAPQILGGSFSGGLSSSECKQWIWGQKGTTKKLCEKGFPARSGELSGAICLKTLVLLCNDLVTPSNNCSENYLVLFVRFFGFCCPFLSASNEGHL